MPDSLEYDIEDRLPPEAYLEVVEMKKVVESKSNWPMLKSVFNIPEAGEKGLAKNLKWMIRVNELRRIAAHPARDRKYKVDDFEYIDFVYEGLMSKLKEAHEHPNLDIAASLEGDDD